MRCNFWPAISRALVLGLFIVCNLHAKEQSCFLSLYIDNEYRELTKVAAENKERREKLMPSSKEDRKNLVRMHLLEAIRYEEKKAQIYISMLEKILQRKADFKRTSLEIRRRLIRSLDYYENFTERLTEFDDFVPKPINAPMSHTVAYFLETGE